MAATVLVIRAHKRFGVCRKARVLREGGDDIEALLIELSLEGCRLGNMAGTDVELGDTLTVRIDGTDSFDGTVRWNGTGAIGLKLARPFHTAELDRLIRLCRGELDQAGPNARAG